jgi:hypothetical protein
MASRRTGFLEPFSTAGITGKEADFIEHLLAA